MLHTAVAHDDGPIALRYPRGEGEGVPIPARPEPIEIGRGEVLREGERVALLGYGYGVSLALGAAADLLAARARRRADGGRRPLRQAARHRAGRAPRRRARPARDGRGRTCCPAASALPCCEHLADRDLPATCGVLRLGLPDRYVTHGKPALLREEVGLTPEAVAGRVAEAVLEPTGAPAPSCASQRPEAVEAHVALVRHRGRARSPACVLRDRRTPPPPPWWPADV